MKSLPLWLVLLNTGALIITNVWFWAAMVRQWYAKGTLIYTMCKHVMCEVRVLFWPAKVITYFYSFAHSAIKPVGERDWTDNIPLNIGFTIFDAIVMWFLYFVLFKDDDEDDRWKKRRARVRGYVQNHLRAPSTVRN